DVAGQEDRTVLADVAEGARASGDGAAEADADAAGHLLLEREVALDAVLAGDPTDRPEHGVGAAGHDAQLAPRLADPELLDAPFEGEGHPTVDADRAILDGQVQGDAEGLHLLEEHQVGGAAGAACMESGARPTPPARRRSVVSGAGAGKLVPSGPSTDRSAPGDDFSSSAVPGPTVLARISACPPGPAESSEN